MCVSDFTGYPLRLIQPLISCDDSETFFGHGFGDSVYRGAGLADVGFRQGRAESLGRFGVPDSGTKISGLLQMIRDLFYRAFRSFNFSDRSIRLDPILGRTIRHGDCFRGFLDYAHCCDWAYFHLHDIMEVSIQNY